MQTLPLRHTNGMDAIFAAKNARFSVFHIFWIIHCVQIIAVNTSERRRFFRLLLLFSQNKWFRFLLFKRANKLLGFIRSDHFLDHSMEESLYAFGTPKNKTQKLCIKFRAGLCWAYKLCMMRRLAANGVQCADSHLKTTTKRAKPKYRATASNKLTIFTWNIKTLVNFQRKCVPAICTKGEGWFGPMPFFFALSLFLSCGENKWLGAKSKWFLLVLRIIAL